MIRAIIFDCFGVLAEDGWLPFKRKYIGDNAVLATEVSDLGKQNDYGLITNDEYFKLASKLIGVEESVLRDAVGRRVPNLELFDFIKNELKPKYKIGLLSNANYDIIHELFVPEQVAVFDASELSYESQLVKPDRRAFELIAARLGVEPNECIFVDDVERYCVGAEAVGMGAIVYTDLEQAQQEILQRLAAP